MKKIILIAVMSIFCLPAFVLAGNQALLEGASERTNRISEQVREQLLEQTGKDGVQMTSVRFKINSDNQVTIIEGKGAFVRNARFTGAESIHGGRVINGSVNILSRKPTSGMIVRGGGAALEKVKPILSGIGESVSVVAITFDEVAIDRDNDSRKSTSYGGGGYLIYW